MDLAVHGVERPLEEAFDGVKICEVALYCLDGATECGDGIRSSVVGLDALCGGAPNEADVGTSLR